MDGLKSTDEMLSENYNELCSLISNETDEEFLKSFFDCLFTPAERKDFAMRWLLVKEIRAGVPQREIAKKYNISLCRITRGSKEVKKEGSAFIKMLERLSSTIK